MSEKKRKGEVTLDEMFSGRFIYHCSCGRRLSWEDGVEATKEHVNTCLDVRNNAI